MLTELQRFASVFRERGGRGCSAVFATPEVGVEFGSDGGADAVLGGFLGDPAAAGAEACLIGGGVAA